MIHYALTCGRAHGFDGWFRDSAAFDEQAAAGLLECPTCGDARVGRALMAPAVPRRRRAPAPVKPVDAAPATVPDPQPAPSAMPAELRAVLQRLRSEVESRCENVGTDFAAEARRMHAGESEKRGIFGDTTPEEAEALAEDGIAVERIPWVPRAES